MQLTGGGFLVALGQVTAVYYALAALLHFVVPRLLPVRSVQKGEPKMGQARTEALNCVGPLLVKALALTAVEKLHAAGYGKMYEGRAQTVPEVAYLVGTIAVLDVLYDTWFYWSHLLMHRWKWLYARVHAMHHKSVTPTPFAGYSFHLVEALIMFAWVVPCVFLIPIHTWLHRLYHLWTMAIHIGGHAGYEVAPFIPTLEAVASMAWVRGRKPCDQLNTVRHHDLHHLRPNGNFSLYFTHWDRLMGTEHANYKQQIAEHYGLDKQE